MRRRDLSAITSIGLFVALCAAAVPAAFGQAADDWEPPRTPWGDPDLQGIYNYGTSTPLQRPSELAGRTVLSDDEASMLEEEIAQRVNQDRRDGG